MYNLTMKESCTVIKIRHTVYGKTGISELKPAGQATYLLETEIFIPYPFHMVQPDPLPN